MVSFSASYVKLLEGKARFDGRSSFKTFLFAVIRRTAAESRRRRLLRELALFRVRRAALLEAPSKGSDQTLLLANAFEKLSRRQREVLELVFGHGLTVEEAGRALGVSVGSARTHYERGKRRLEALLRG